jgi:DNA-binding NarL/FixJ family response regulator
MNGLQALAMLTKRHPELPVILLSGGVPDDIVQEALQQGAVAFLHKSGSSHELLAVVRNILSGDIHLPTMQANPIDTPSNESSENNGQVALTTRQNQVLALLMQGLSNKAISRELSISEETVKNHLSAIFRSLGVQNRMQAALAAKRLGYASEGKARD